VASSDQPMKNISTTRVHFYLLSIYHIEAAVFCLRIHLLNFGQRSIAGDKKEVLLDNTMSQLTSMVTDWR
jgi:hypothetical protein